MPSLQRVRTFFAARPDLRAPPRVILSGDDPKEHAHYLENGATRVVLKPAGQEALLGLRALACEHMAAFDARGGSPGAAAAPATSSPRRLAHDSHTEMEPMAPGAATTSTEICVEIGKA